MIFSVNRGNHSTIRRSMRYFITLSLFISMQLYGGEISTVLTKNKKLDKLKLKEYIEWVSPCIQSYPPRFKDEVQRKKIMAATSLICKEIRDLSINDINDIDTLIDLGYVLSMGHNLDLGTAELSKHYFEKALVIDPDNVRANYLLGMFLVSTRKYFYDSIPYLDKALKLGKQDAEYTLGLIYIRKGNTDKGMKMLKDYSEKNPKNEYVKMVIKAVKEKELEFKEGNVSSVKEK